MPYSIGAAHVLSGSGTTSLASPIGLRVALSSIPAYTARRSLSPVEYFRLGSLSVGNVDGWLPVIHLVHDAQLVLPLPAGLDTLGYELLGGLVATVHELVDTQPNVVKAPWDRNPVRVHQYAFAVPTGPTGATVAWTYTVPAGKRFNLEHGEISRSRLAAATAGGSSFFEIRVDNVRVLDLRHDNNLAGDRDRATLRGPILLLAGQVLTANYSTADTGGTQKVAFIATGYEFDA